MPSSGLASTCMRCLLAEGVKLVGLKMLLHCRSLLEDIHAQAQIEHIVSSRRCHARHDEVPSAPVDSMRQRLHRPQCGGNWIVNVILTRVKSTRKWMIALSTAVCSVPKLPKNMSLASV